jgi:hypothetical protein
MKVSPFLRQETARLRGLPKAVFASGQAAKAGVRFGTLGIHLRAPLTIEVEARGASAGQSSRDIPRGDIDFRRYRRSLSPKNQLDPFVDVMH